MNCPITPCTTPVAVPRAGRGGTAPPQRPETQAQLPFAALPHDLRKDPRLKRNKTAIVLAAALLEYARSKPSCYPSNARLAADLGCCPQTVRNALTALVAAGWVKVVLGADQPNGRRIWLCWRCTTQPTSNPPSDQPRITSIFPYTQSTTHQDQDTPPLTPSLLQLSDTLKPVGPPLKPVGDPLQPVGDPLQPVGLEMRIRGEEERNVTIPSPTREQEQPRSPGPEAAAPCPQQPPTDGPPTPPVASRRTTPPTTGPATPPGPPRPLQDELKAIPGAGPSQIRAVAWRLAHHLRDTASVGFFILVLSLVASGSAPVGRLLAAYVAADRSRGKAQKPGALFVSVWSGWQPALKPSEINRPQYHQAPSPPVVCASPSPAPVPEAPAELSREEELAELRSWLDQPRHPFAGIARRRLAELGELGVAT